jgi:hypothetical protein
LGFFYVPNYLYGMKIIVTEEQKKKLFIPRKIDEREKEYLKLIGMEPVIQYLKDNDTSITVQMSRDHNEWYWHVHSVFDDNTGGDLDEFEKPIKDLFISITSSIENIYQIGGILSITDENNLLVEYDYLIGVEKSGDKTYQL